MAMANYGVTERYYIDITNDTNVTKKVTYNLKTGSHVFVKYQVGNGAWHDLLKLGEDNPAKQAVDMFDFTIAPGETKRLTMEVILPNADPGGLKHRLSAITN